jgi:hypothetical protein
MSELESLLSSCMSAIAEACQPELDCEEYHKRYGPLVSRLYRTMANLELERECQTKLK